MKAHLVIVAFLFLSPAASGQNLFRTVCQGKINRLDSLLQHESINIQDNRGRSLLHWAIGCRQTEVFEYLIEKGIDINIEDIEHKTPLHVSVRMDNEQQFDLLIDRQIDTSWIDRYGAGLLERAVLNQSSSFVHKLVDLGIGVDSRNSRGSTALEISRRIGADDIFDLLLAHGADKSKMRTFIKKGKYFGEDPPDLLPQIFSPNFISTEESEFGCVFNGDGTEFYYAVDVNGKNEIRFSKMIDGRWSDTEVILWHDRYGYNDPFLSPGEDRLYFISDRAIDGVGDTKDIDIWYVNKLRNGWSEPVNAGSNINTVGNEYYISFTNTGRMYFSSNGHDTDSNEREGFDILYADFENGAFKQAVRLGDAVNTESYEADVFVSPDESFLIFCSSRENGFGQGDLYISFKNEDGIWSTAINMGESINTPHYEYCPFVSRDGKYLFYTSRQDIYWVSTTVIDKLKHDKISNRK